MRLVAAAALVLARSAAVARAAVSLAAVSRAAVSRAAVSRAAVSRAAVSLAAVSLAAAGMAASARASVLIVTKRHVKYHHYGSVQSAVNAARPGDWILIDRGVYPGSVTIDKPRLHLLGINRNQVIIDGRHRAGNGIVVRADGVWIENLTVRNFDRRSLNDTADGNEIWWNGGAGSGRIGMHGWWGQYLTVYDTGLLGGYGLYVSNAVDGFWKHVLASGFNDSGLYVGACRSCDALVQDAVVEDSALGWSSTNAGGRMVVEDSTFRDNGVGIAPDSEATDDLPAPQDGACNAGSNRSPLPRFRSTRIARCTVFRDDLVQDNGNIDTPANATLLAAPWGVGVMLPGDYADLVQDNTITGNPTFGALVFEEPNPFPPTGRTVYFQASGNRVSDNRFAGNGTNPGGADIGLEGGVFGTETSVNNCFSGNSFSSSIPAGIEGIWGCQHARTPNGGAALYDEILDLIIQSGDRDSRPQPVPAAQPTMPAPCRGVPSNPLCK